MKIERVMNTIERSREIQRKFTGKEMADSLAEIEEDLFFVEKEKRSAEKGLTILSFLFLASFIINVAFALSVNELIKKVF